jgi:hypothetical protein
MNSLSFANPGGAQTNRPDGYSFDANGNLTNDVVNALYYDAENHTFQAGGALGNCATASGCYTYL